MTPSESQTNDERTQQYLTLLGQHEGRLLGFILSLVPNWADADDIAQEVRIRLWKQFDGYDPAKDFALGPDHRLLPGIDLSPEAGPSERHWSTRNSWN